MSIPIVGGLISKAKSLLSEIKIKNIVSKKDKVIKNNNNNCNSVSADRVTLSPVAKDMLACSKYAHGGGTRGRITQSTSQT